MMVEDADIVRSCDMERYRIEMRAIQTEAALTCDAWFRCLAKSLVRYASGSHKPVAPVTADPSAAEVVWIRPDIGNSRGTASSVNKPQTTRLPNKKHVMAL